MRTAALVALSSLASGAALAQEPSPKPAFEVVSIRPASGQFTVMPNGVLVGGAMRGGPGTDEPGRMTSNYIPAIGFFQRAFGVRPYQISGPGWISVQRYDFVATVPAGSTTDQVALMFQQMLADRFALKAHHESKEFPGYNLVIAKNGPKLKESMPIDVCAIGGIPTGGCPKTVYQTGIALSTSTMPIGGSTMQGSVRRIAGRGLSIENLANMIQTQLGGPVVVDKTELTEKYDYRIEFAPLNIRPDDDTPYPTIFTALEKDLGFKLEPTKVPLDTIVIDQIERPSEN